MGHAFFLIYATRAVASEVQYCGLLLFAKPMPSRKLFITLETSGIEIDTDRIVDLAAIEVLGEHRTGVELVTRLNPEKSINEGATAIHGLTLEMLAREPTFADIAAELQRLMVGAEIIVQNAVWDISFLDAEFGHLGMPGVSTYSQSITCLFSLSRKLNPGASGSLRSLCERYGVERVPMHSGAVDYATCMASVYLLMTKAMPQ